MKFEVSINEKIVKLDGYYVGHTFCVKSSSIDNHPSLTPNEKENLKMRFKSDRSLILY